jgi:hypothetical protein
MKSIILVWLVAILGVSAETLESVAELVQYTQTLEQHFEFFQMTNNMNVRTDRIECVFLKPDDRFGPEYSSTCNQQPENLRLTKATQLDLHTLLIQLNGMAPTQTVVESESIASLRQINDQLKAGLKHATSKIVSIVRESINATISHKLSDRRIATIGGYLIENAYTAGVKGMLRILAHTWPSMEDQSCWINLLNMLQKWTVPKLGEFPKLFWMRFETCLHSPLGVELTQQI